MLLLLLQSAEAIQLHSKDFVDSSMVFEDPSEYLHTTDKVLRHAYPHAFCNCHWRAGCKSTELNYTPAGGVSACKLHPASHVPVLTGVLVCRWCDIR